MIKKIALVAHDARKQELVSWVKFNAGSLKECELFCTGTTGRLIEAALREVLGDEAHACAVVHQDRVQELRAQGQAHRSNARTLQQRH